MSDKRYYGRYHTFTDRKEGGDITLRAGPSETLVIDGTFDFNALGGTDKDVMFVDGTSIGFDTKFNFNKTTNALSTDIYAGQKYTDDLGKNQLTLTGAFQHTNTSVADNQGTSVSLSTTATNNIFTMGCPDITKEFDSCNVVFVETAGPSFSQITSTFAYQTFTSFSLASTYSDISEDGLNIVQTDYATSTADLTVWTATSETWSSTSSKTITGGGVTCKISGNYILSCQYTGILRVYFLSGGTWGLQQTLNAGDLGSGLFYSLFDVVNEDHLVYNQSGNLRVYDRSATTWTNTQSIDLTGEGTLIGLHIWPESATTTWLACCSNAKFLLYKRTGSAYALQTSFSVANIVDVCTNGSYVFLLTTSGVNVYSIINSTWTKSTNDTTIASGTRMSCNSEFIIIGQPSVNTYGQGSVYSIADYVNQLEIINSITANEVGNDNITINSIRGDVNITSTTGDVDIVSSAGSIALQASSVTNTGVIINSVGAFNAPSYSFSWAPTTGIYSSNTNKIDFSVLSVNVGHFDELGLTAKSIATTGNAYGNAQGSGAQAIPNATNTTLTGSYWNGAISTAGLGSEDLLFTAGGEWTIARAGVYLITATVSFSPNAVGRRSMDIRLNGAGTHGYINVASTTGTDRTSLNASTVLILQASDLISVNVYQTSGGNLAMDGAVLGEFQAYRIN